MKGNLWNGRKYLRIMYQMRGYFPKYILSLAFKRLLSGCSWDPCLGREGKGQSQAWADVKKGVRPSQEAPADTLGALKMRCDDPAEVF